MAGTGMRASARLALHRLHHSRMPVSQEQRPVTRPIIDQFMPVHIPLVRPLGQMDVDRKRLQITEIVRDPARKKFLGSKIQLARIPKLGLIALEPRSRSEDNLGHGSTPDTLLVE